MENKNKGARHEDRNGKLIPKELSVSRNERIIVTYSHDFAQFLEHKRQERPKASRAIVKNKKRKDANLSSRPTDMSMKYITPKTEPWPQK